MSTNAASSAPTGIATRTEALATSEARPHDAMTSSQTGESSSTAKLPRRTTKKETSDSVWQVQHAVGGSASATHQHCACVANGGGRSRSGSRNQANVACCALLRADSDEATPSDSLEKACDAGLSKPADSPTHSSLLPSMGQGTIKSEGDADTTAIGSNASDGAGGEGGKREVCCREQIEEDRSLVSHDVVRDIIIGLSDGLMVPFALTAGLSSLGSSRLVIQGGFAELISGAISMGIGGYLAAKAEQDTFRHRFAFLANKLNVACSSEIDREVHEILGPLGVRQGVSRLVARSLELAQREEEEQDAGRLSEGEKMDFGAVLGDAEGVEKPRKADLTAATKPKTSSWHAMFGLVSKPHVPTRGTSAFLIKFGDGMEEVPSRRLFISAFTIGISYFLGGLIPIIPYLCIGDALHGLYWSIFATGVILIIFGVTKAWFTGAATGWAGLVWGAASTLAVGAAAAAASYGVVKGLERGGQ